MANITSPFSPTAGNPLRTINASVSSAAVAPAPPRVVASSLLPARVTAAAPAGSSTRYGMFNNVVAQITGRPTLPPPELVIPPAPAPISPGSMSVTPVATSPAAPPALPPVNSGAGAASDMVLTSTTPPAAPSSPAPSPNMIVPANTGPGPGYPGEAGPYIPAPSQWELQQAGANSDMMAQGRAARHDYLQKQYLLIGGGALAAFLLYRALRR